MRAGLLGGVPVVLADGLGHAFEHLRLGGRVVLLKPVAGAQFAAVVDVGVEQCLPLVIAHGRGVHGLPAEQVVGHVQHLQRAGVAFGLHALDPLRVEVAHAQLIGEKAVQTGGAGVAAAQVGDQQLGRCAIELADGSRQPAKKLERVIGRQHAMQVGGARHDRCLGAAQLACQQVGRAAGLAPALAAKGVAVAGKKLLGEHRIVVPFGRRHGQVRHTGAVFAGGVAEDAVARGLGCLPGAHALGLQLGGDAAVVGGNRVAGLVQLGQPGDGIVQQAHEVVELVAVDAGDLHHHVAARSAQLAGRNDLQCGHPTAVIPDRSQPQRMQHLRLGHTEMADGFR